MFHINSISLWSQLMGTLYPIDDRTRIKQTEK